MPELDVGSTVMSAVNTGINWVTGAAATGINAASNFVGSIGEGISNFFNSGDGTERYTGATQSGSEYIYSQSAVLSECTFLASRLFGGPILFTDAVDPHLDFDGNIMGRMTAQRIMHDPTIISLSPGKVKFSSGLQGDGADQLHKYLMDPTDESTINGLTEDSFASDKLLYTFEQDYNNYMNYVNMIARVMSVYMGIGQKTVRLPFADGTTRDTGITYSTFDWRKFQNKDGEVPDEGGKDFFGEVLEDLAANLQYVHFYGQNNSSYSEETSTSTRTSSVESQIESSFMSTEQLKDVAFLSGLSGDSAALVDSIIQNSGLADQGFGAIINQAKDYFKGGKMVFPQMIDTSSYGKSISLSFKFVSPSGDPESVFINEMLPIAHLMAFAMPRQLGANTYTYPFLVRCFARGWMNCEMGVVTSFRIQRGGQEDIQYNVFNQATEIDVSMDITPLYNIMYISKTTDGANFFKNTGLQEYLGTLCGLNMKGDILSMQKQLVFMIGRGYLFDIKANIKSMSEDFMANIIQNFVQLP